MAEDRQSASGCGEGGSAAPEIVWVPSVKVGALRHGMVGQVRAFTLDTLPRPNAAAVRVARSLGVQEIQCVPDDGSARLLADELLAEFLGRLRAGDSSAG
ncbi:hypothetical protein [Sphaerisporangium aureirubrum]|uniref:Uncharacterized protein n=1 Tax=Sphaerisporangium aureirubrum TaxID=1544736 RepID=A0ABW1NGM2_9ACTN